MSTEAYILDAVRTPRGRGKKNGSLHEVKPVDLLGTLFKALQERHNLDTSQVNDVVLGCVTPVGDQGADIAKIAPCMPGGISLCPECSSTASALPVSKPSTWQP